MLYIVVLCILLNTNDSNHLSVYDVDSRRGLFRYVSMLRQIRGGETQSVGFGVMETRALKCALKCAKSFSRIPRSLGEFVTNL